MTLARSFLISIVAASFFFAGECRAAFTIFLQTENPVIDGDGVAAGFANAWQISSFSQGITLPITGAGGDRQVGTSQFSDFAVVKFLDRASALMLFNVASGASIGKVTITFQTVGAKPYTAYKVVLENVLASSIAQETSPTSATNGVTETVKFNFTRITWSYYPQTASGSVGPPITTSWDLTAGPP